MQSRTPEEEKLVTQVREACRKAAKDAPKTTVKSPLVEKANRVLLRYYGL